MKKPAIFWIPVASLVALFILAPLARAEQVVISEIHYNPKAGKPEYIELQNLTATVFDIAEWRFTNGVEYTFPPYVAATTSRTFLGKFERILVAGVDEATLRAAYPAIPAAVKIFGPWLGVLNNGGETITVKDRNGVRMAEVNYGDDGRKWPVSADGAGHSVRLVKENYGAGDWRNWAASAVPDGTPGAADTAPAAGSIAGKIALNEVHFGQDGKVDWVELRSTTAEAIPTEGLKLASALDFADGVPLTGTVAGTGVASWDVQFTPDLNGEVRIFLVTADGTVLAAQKFDRRGDGTVESFQAGSPGNEWYAGPGPTRNAANTPLKNADMVINEIMFDSPSDARNSEFIELHNKGTAAVNLSGWKFVDGVNYEFPANTLLAPGGYLVVAADPAFMATSYNGLLALGPFSGSLSDSGELVRLEDNRRSLADEVDYKPGGDWPDLADGDGSSMELKHPGMDNSFPTAWADSDESAKPQMQTYTYTAPFQRVTFSPLTSGQELHVFLVGDAHAVLKNVSLRLNGAGDNLVKNPVTMSTTFASNLGWVFQGTHAASFIQDGEIHVLADGHGDNKVNRGEVDLANLVVNSNYTLTFDARWVSGKPRLIVQTLDHGFGTSFALPVPNNLGTPGAANSRRIATPAPALADVFHSPAVPTPAQPVSITARVATSGVDTPTVEVVHRLDNAAGSNAWVRHPMFDDGATDGDVVAGDGIFTASLTQYPTQGNIAQFYVEARAAGGVGTVMPQFGANRPALFMKDSRVMPKVLLRERIILSLRDRNALGGAGNTAAFTYDYPRMSNHFFNCTLINNESEIRYNAAIRKSGSPFTRDSGSTLAHGKWQVPGDRLFRGRSKTVMDPSGASITPRYYDDRVARYFMYLLGLPSCEMEYAHYAINTDTFALRELHEPIATDFCDRVWDNGSEGTLLRIDDEWYFPNDASDDGRNSRNADWSYKNSDNPIRYQTEWLMRSREADNDYSTFIEFVRTLGRNQFTEPAINRMADRDMLCVSAAVRGYDADWDTITMDRGKNAYFYRHPVNGRWLLIHWDGDRVFEDANRGFLGGLTGISTYFNKPYIRRTLNYYMTELLTKHTKGSARTEAWMQAEKTAIAGSGVNISDAHYRTWFNSRETPARNFIGTPRNAAFAITTTLPETPDNTITLTGTSPSSVYQVRVAGQPWAVPEWTSTTAWKLSGITLKTGANTITVEGVNHEGVIVLSQAFTTNKTGNPPPVMSLSANPASYNVSQSESLVLDASASADPDGLPLTFTWTPPAANAVLQSNHGTATTSFQKPGLYPVTVAAADDAGSSSLTREAAVFGPGGFSSFGSEALDSFWELRNIKARDNILSGPFYSLQTPVGRLHLHLPEIKAWPFGPPPPATGMDSLTYPWIKRDLPSSTDWVMQTDLELSGVQFGSFIAGLQVEVLREGAQYRYAIGYKGGNELAVLETAPSGVSTTLVASAWALRDSVSVRIRRKGTALVFSWRFDDQTQFLELHRLQLPAGSTAVEGGPFAATETPVNLNVLFDYAMLIDPSSTASAADELVVTEVMYKPNGGDAYEFLELFNNGTTPINLTGYRFPQGEPFDEFVFPNTTIAPGDWLLVVNDLAAFRSRYGNGPDLKIAGEWAGGNLSNSGETITLLDNSGLVVLSFEYGDTAPWPVNPDLNGSSLTLAKATTGNTGNGADYTSSSAPGGSPGRGDTIVAPGLFAAWMTARGERDPLAIKPGEVMNNFLTYGFGLDLAGASLATTQPVFGTTVLDNLESKTFEYRRRLGDPTLKFELEQSADGEAWASAAVLVAGETRVPLGNGSEMVTLKLTPAFTQVTKIFLRLRIKTP